MQEGETGLLLGNEAVVRGALEAGVGVASTYPGTPSSEIGDTFWRLRNDYPFYFEYSANEKVALEVAAAAAASNVRAMVSMKHVGLNVAADSFVSTGYVGSRAGLVIVVADDPSLHSSQNEQDSRIYARLANLPLLEPGTPQEALDFTRQAFDISESLGVPVMLRLTTRVSHTRAPVEVGAVANPTIPGRFEHDAPRFVPVPAYARQMRKRVLERYDEARELAETHAFNRVIDGTAQLGIIASGAGGAYAREVRSRLGEDIPVLLLGFSHPIPEKTVTRFATRLDGLLVVEETEPVMESEIKAALFDAGLLKQVYGRRSGHIPRAYELTPEIVEEAAAQVLRLLRGEENASMEKSGAGAGTPPAETRLPSRNPVLCPGCPHRHSYYAAKRAVSALKREDLDPIFPSDIGCYSLGVAPPFELADFMLSMGSSVGSAGGFAAATDQPVIAFIGDSTFFHAGLPALASAVHNGHDFTLIVLDNRTTAMTGHQPHPGIGFSDTGREDGTELHELSISDVARGMGAGWVKVIDPNDLRSAQRSIREAIQYPGVAVVVSRAPCILLSRHQERGTSYIINTELCTECGLCTEHFGCPAIARDDGVLAIDQELCNGCGVCQQVCAHNAIEEVSA